MDCGEAIVVDGIISVWFQDNVHARPMFELIWNGHAGGEAAGPSDTCHHQPIGGGLVWSQVMAGPATKARPLRVPGDVHTWRDVGFAAVWPPVDRITDVRVP